MSALALTDIGVCVCVSVCCISGFEDQLPVP